jgi:hypothetical protein
MDTNNTGYKTIKNGQFIDTGNTSTGHKTIKNGHKQHRTQDVLLVSILDCLVSSTSVACIYELSILDCLVSSVACVHS